MQDILNPTFNELYHHGILGQKWGVRRYQNSDGSLTSAGRIRYGVNSLRSVASKASDTVNSLKGKSFNDFKIDALDYANRKGVLDFLDSKANEPFSAVRSSLNNTDQSSKANDFISDYTSQAYNSIDKALGKINRYSTVVSAMRKNEPYVKVEDTSKPWMETFKNGMMGWNHTSDIENAVRNRAADKYADFLSSENYRGQSVSEAFGANFDDVVGKYIHAEKGRSYMNIEPRDDPGQYTRNLIADVAKTSSVKFTQQDAEKAFSKAAGDYIRALSNEGHLVKWNWDSPMDIETIDGLKVNSVIYNNGGGVQRQVSKATAERRAKTAKEVQDFIEETGRLPTVITNKPYSAPNNAGINTNYVRKLHRDNVYDWVMTHSDVPDFLEHHGIKGQKWGNRRYQNDDGSLTALGRVHYGVGAARESVGKAARAASGALKSGASRTGEAIRKAVKPTDQELLEQYNKAQAKQARKDLKQEIREMNGHKKRIKDMTDQEVLNQINRYRNEATLKALRKDAHKTPLQKSLEQATRDAISRAAGATLQAALGNVGQSIANAFDTKENKVRRKAQMVEDQAKIDKAKGGKSAADILKEYSENASNSKKAYQAQLEEAALRGNEDAKKKLSDFKNASKGSYKDPTESPDYVETEENKATYEPPASKSSKRQNENNVSDVIREAGSNEYSTVEDAPTGEADDYISRLSREDRPTSR